MNKLISLLLCLLLLAALTVPVLATTEPEEEVTTSSEEILEWESSEITFETIPLEKIEGLAGAIKGVITEDGTLELPADESGAIKWNTWGNSTLTIGAITDGESYTDEGSVEGYVQFDDISGDYELGIPAQDTLSQPATGAPSWLGNIAKIICTIVLGLILLALVALIVIALIILIVSLGKKNSKKKET